MTRRLLAFITALCLVFSMVPVAFAADPSSGTLDNGMTWVLDESGTLTVSGTGPMVDFENVNDVPWYAHASSITTVVVEPGITTIGDRAFCALDRVTTVSLPESITAIGYAGFSECYKLTDITLPEGLVSIGEQAFYANNSLTVLELPASVRTIGDRAFSNCEGLQSMTIPEGITEIGEHTFSWCKSLTEVNLPNTITAIGPSAFMSCFKLESITIPNGITVISDSAFSQCSSLAEVAIPEGVTSIGYSAFYNCTGLTTVSLPSTLESIDDQAFSLCSSLTGFQVDENNPVFANADDGTLYSKDYTTLYQVPGVTTSFVIPDTVTNINYGAFWGCYGLTEVKIPDSVTTIGDWAFSSCNSLTEVVIPDSVTEIGQYSFSFCSLLTDVTLSESLTVIPYRAFKECPELTDILIPDSVQLIDGGAFGSCTGLTWVIIPAAVDQIESYAFDGCNGLMEIHFMGNAPTFGQYSVFGSVTATCYYAAEDDTWTDDVMKDYGGTLTWIADDTIEPEPTVPSEPEETEPVETEPVETEPVETEPVETEPVETEPVETEPVETEPVETEPVETEPVETEPVETEPVETEPVETEPVETDPVETEPSEPEDGIIASGTCGSNASWVLDADGVLTLSGVGEVYPEEVDTAPWYGYRDQILHLVIEDGITLVWGGAFWGCSEMKTAVIADSVVELNAWTFEGCSALTEVKLSENLISIQLNLFMGCSSLESIIVPDSVLAISESAFENCTALQKVVIPDSVTQIADDAFENCPNLTIYCYNLSFAHMYAEAYGIPYEILEDEPNTPVYNINVTCGSGGTATITPNPSPANRYVVLEVQPDNGYAMSEVRYQCVSAPGLELAYEQISDTLIVFFMPASDVEMAVYFTPLESPFKDVKETDYFYEPVLWAVSYGITAGVGNGRFAPTDPCTRAQVVTFLWRAAGEPEPVSGHNPFKDVKASDYYYKAVLWAVENGITAGTSANKFSPTAPCTRAQVVSFLWRAAGEPDPYYGYNPFTDVKSSDYYYDAVLWAVENGITAGMTNTTFAPGNTCTRGQVVSFLYRFLHG